MEEENDKLQSESEENLTINKDEIIKKIQRLINKIIIFHSNNNRVWRSHTNKKIYKYFRDIIFFRSKYKNISCFYSYFFIYLKKRQSFSATKSN